MKKGKGKGFFSTLGEIFSPMIPAFLAAGMCTGFSSLLITYSHASFLLLVARILRLVSLAFTTYLSAWIGVSAARRFGATPILGGVLGMVSLLGEVGELAEQVGIEAFLHQGSGGAIAVIGGVFLLSRIEKLFKEKLPLWFNMVFAPFVSIILALVPYLFIIMPAMGLVTGSVSDGIMFLCSNDNLVVRIITGYVCAALFLPAQLIGLQPVFHSLYIIQMESAGIISIVPILAMAGAAQVGVALCMFLKARSVGNDRLCGVCAGGMLPGVLGIGNALLYGMSVPYPKALLSTCIGAGFAGSFIAIMQVYATGYGSSGLLAIPLMTAGAGSPVQNMVRYAIGLSISFVAGFVFAAMIVKKESLEENENA